MCRLGARSPAPRPPLAPLRARGSARSPAAPPLLSAEVRNLGELCGVGLGALVCSLRAPGACGRLGSGHCGAAGSAPRKAGAPAGHDLGVEIFARICSPSLVPFPSQASGQRRVFSSLSVNLNTGRDKTETGHLLDQWPVAKCGSQFNQFSPESAAQVPETDEGQEN